MQWGQGRQPLHRASASVPAALWGGRGSQGPLRTAYTRVSSALHVRRRGGARRPLRMAWSGASGWHSRTCGCPVPWCAGHAGWDSGTWGGPKVQKVGRGRGPGSCTISCNGSLVRYKTQVTPASSACVQALTPHCLILQSSIDDSLPKQNTSFSHIGPVPTEIRYNCIIRKYSLVFIFEWNKAIYLLTNLTECVDRYLYTSSPLFIRIQKSIPSPIKLYILSMCKILKSKV